MKVSNPQLPLKGSERREVAGAQRLSASDPQQKIAISIYARRNPTPNRDLLDRLKELAEELPGQRKYFTEEEFNEAFGASQGDLEAIASWATENKLSVLEKNVSTKRVKAEGTIGDLSKAFATELYEYSHPSLGNYRGRSGYLFVPHALHAIIEGVFGLDTRPVGSSKRARGRFDPVALKELSPAKTGGGFPINPYKHTYYPPQVAGLYNFPGGVDGTGQNLAVFVFNGDPMDPHGGYSPAALQSYYKKILAQKVPVIKDVIVQGPGNDPGPEDNNANTTGEVYLDLCVTGALVPGANIFAYFTEYTSQGWVDALHQAISDANNIDVISISYGLPEQDSDGNWTPMSVNVVAQVLEAASAKGITICCSSGDNGSVGLAGQAQVEFPASSPYVLAVGGTHLLASAGLTTIVKETVWRGSQFAQGATGGGISSVFTKPEYQDAANVPPSVNASHVIGRGVPDVAAVADPNTGVMVVQPDGKSVAPVGGTSASAPLWASLIIRLNQALGANCGFINTVLYSKCANNVLNDITSGNNGAYSAGPGWDACTGLGSPDGEKLLAALK